jgi:hypothetical protein
VSTSAPSQGEREELLRKMRSIVESFGALEGFRKTDLEHDRTFLFEHWSGAPFVWVRYNNGTHLLSLIALDARRRRIILSALETIDLNFEGAIYFLAREPEFALQPFSRDALRDEVIAHFDFESGYGATHGACQP